MDNSICYNGKRLIMGGKIGDIFAKAVVASLLTTLFIVITMILLCVFIKYTICAIIFIVLFIPTYYLVDRLVDETYNSKEE